MGTGLLAPLYRFGLIPQALDRAIHAIKPRPYANSPTIPDYYGVLSPTGHLPFETKNTLATRYAYRARAEIALDVASNYPGGDYLEFGASGLCTFRSFLSAFDINGARTANYPDAKFWAFDIFGDPDRGNPSAETRRYFEGYRHPHAAPIELLKPYGALADRCAMVHGYFEDTLNDALRAQFRDEQRTIGFAFLDCNIAPSYKVALGFLLDVLTPKRTFIYLDEYFTDQNIVPVYDAFSAEAERRHGLRSIYMRNAGSFGALFCLMPIVST